MQQISKKFLGPLNPVGGNNLQNPLSFTISNSGVPMTSFQSLQGSPKEIAALYDEAKAK